MYATHHERVVGSADFVPFEVCGCSHLDKIEESCTRRIAEPRLEGLKRRMARLVSATPAGARRQSEILRSAQNDSSDIRPRPPTVILSEAKNLALVPRNPKAGT